MLVVVAIVEPPVEVAEPLQVVEVGGLAVVVARAAAPPAVEPETLRAHDAAIRALCARHPAVLPARFGQVSANEAALVRSLSDRRTELQAALAEVRGRAQMTLRISRRDAAPNAASPDPNRPGTSFLQARARAATLPELDPLRRALDGLVRGERTEPTAPPSAPWQASVYHLVERGSAARYLELVGAAAADLETHGITVAASGPWPCYAFATGDLA